MFNVKFHPRLVEQFYPWEQNPDQSVVGQLLASPGEPLGLLHDSILYFCCGKKKKKKYNQ